MVLQKFTCSHKQSKFNLTVYLYRGVIEAIALLKSNEESPDSKEHRTGE